MMIDVKNAKTKELVAFYNEHSGAQPIRKFANRKIAERRVQELVDQLTDDLDIDDDMLEGDVEGKGQDVVAKTDDVGGKGQDVGVKNRTLSEAIAKSWQAPDVRARRRERSAVIVDGQWYRSVRQAFEHLGLPINEHIKFRMTLKEKEEVNAYGHHWTVEPLNYE